MKLPSGNDNQNNSKNQIIGIQRHVLGNITNISNPNISGGILSNLLVSITSI